MKDKRLWMLLGGVLVVGAAFLFLDFRVAVGNPQSLQRIMTTELEGNYPDRLGSDDTISLALVGEGSLVRALQKALTEKMNDVGMGRLELERKLEPKYPNPVLVVKVDQPSLLWTPFFATSQFSVQAGYATDGDTIFMDGLDKTQPYIRNPDPSVVNLYTEYEVNDRSWGLISRPGYDRYLADYLAQEIVQAWKNLYNIQDPTGGVDVSAQPSLATSGPDSSPFPTRTAAPTRLLLSPTPIFEGMIDQVAIDPGGRLYAGGYGAIGENVRHLAKWDGAKWMALDQGLPTSGNLLVADGAGQLYTDILTDSNQGSATAMMRWDGVSWEDITGNFSTAVDALMAGRISSNIPVTGLAMDGEEDLYAAGSFYYPSADNTAERPMGYVAEWNKGTWTVLGPGFDKVNIYGLVVSAAGQVYVSGEQPGAGFIARWDGETWTQIRTSRLAACSSIQNLALDNAGGLYASCIWSGAGELIFYWDGKDWTTITDRLQGEAPYVADMAVDENGHLYIGGSFDSVSGIPARNIAYWDGSSWHALGDGLKGQVYALAFDPSGGLYAAGLLTEVGGLPAHHMARWDGETWQALGP